MTAKRTLHDARIIGDLLQHGLQLLASVQRELHADQLVPSTKNQLPPHFKPSSLTSAT